VALDIRSPMDLVYECFAKLGLRYICVLRDGQYAGMVSSGSLCDICVTERLLSPLVASEGVREIRA
jgi:hypothetical protein